MEELCFDRLESASNGDESLKEIGVWSSIYHIIMISWWAYRGQLPSLPELIWGEEVL